jgi:proline dehydrogenase
MITGRLVPRISKLKTSRGIASIKPMIFSHNSSRSTPSSIPDVGVNKTNVSMQVPDIIDKTASFRTATLSIDRNITPPSNISTTVPMNPLPDFNTNAMAFQNKSTVELFRAAFTFGLCTISPLIRHAEAILHYSKRILGPFLTNHVLRVSIYHHFCAGNDLTAIQPTVQQLQNSGIGYILDYAAEDDGEDDADHNRIAGENSDNVVTKYDRNFERFQQSISHSMTSSSSTATTEFDGRYNGNYVAIKVTALGDPTVLARMSNVINRYRRDDLPQDVNNAIDDFIRAQQLPPLDTTNSIRAEELSDVRLSTKELQELERIYERCHQLAVTAKEHGVRLLFDAEQVRFQPTIDALVLHLQRKYNHNLDSTYPIIYNTYQCYLKDATQRLQNDLKLSSRYQYRLGIKLVRGAYMESERYLAKKLGQPSPIHDTINDTHDSYNQAIMMALQAVAQRNNVIDGSSVELMCATHNQESIECAIHTMNSLKIDRTSHCISFAQLYSMKDNLTYNLGLHRYHAYKYLPYGDITLVTPYLLRRANENSAIRGSAKDEIRMIVKEVTRRIRSAIGIQ